MRILLDTHVFLWWLADDPRLSLAARRRIHDATDVFISSASICEATIKARLGKLDVDAALLVTEIGSNGFRDLPITAAHAAAVAALPDLHRDPFDRILIAQAMTEPLRFLTADALLAICSDLVEVL